MACRLSDRDEIYNCISNSVIRFGFLKIGSGCNGKSSHLFTEAECDFSFVTNKDKGVFFATFNQIFRHGLEFLNGLKNGTLTNLTKGQQSAIKVLDDFLLQKDLHEKNISKILKNYSSKAVSETEITIALAEHLLGRLSPGQSYVIDSKTKGKSDCKCGCQAKIKYGPTGIGHEEVWHGFIDIMFESHDGLSDSAATTIPPKDDDSSSFVTPVKKPKLEDQEDEDEEDSAGGRSITEVKVSLTGAENQSLAQTVVFALLQKSRHPNFQNHLIPNILISPHSFRIIMYDAEKDFLIVSQDIDIFLLDCSYTFSPPAIIVLWMVLHYRMFCVGLVVNIDVQLLQSNFRERVAEKWQIYSKSLKQCMPNFPIIKKTGFIDAKTLCVGIPVHSLD